MKVAKGEKRMMLLMYSPFSVYGSVMSSKNSSLEGPVKEENDKVVWDILKIFFHGNSPPILVKRVLLKSILL